MTAMATGDHGPRPSPPTRQRFFQSPAQRTATRLLRKALLSPKTQPLKNIVPHFSRERGSKPPPWSESEERALVQFIALHRDLQPNANKEWPMMGLKVTYWRRAATYIKEVSASSTRRIANAVRTKAARFAKFYKRVSDAEDAFGITTNSYAEDEPCRPAPTPSTSAHLLPPLSLPKELTDILDKLISSQKLEVVKKLLFTLPDADIVSVFSSLLSTLTDQSLLVSILVQLLSSLTVEKSVSSMDSSFLLLAERVGIKSKPSDFISHSVKAMKKLQAAGKTNLVYKFPKCISLERPGSTESLLPIDRMPFGLIAYQIDFFEATHVNQIKVSKDFALWRETLDAELTARQDKLITGPMWSGCDKADIGVPQKAKVNIACRSKKTVMRGLKTEVMLSSKPEIQTTAIKHLHEVHRENAEVSPRFWLKADGTDVKCAIQESIRGHWNGDVDLLDGKLENMRRSYDERKSTYLNSLTIPGSDLEPALKQLQEFLDNDKTFLTKGLESAVAVYTSKFQAANTPEETLKSANWEVVEFTTLLTQCQQFVGHFQTIIDRISSGTINDRQVVQNCQKIEQDYFQYVKNVYKKKRQPPASHVLVFMVSEERRSMKPYAAPLQYIPYHSLRDQYLRDFGRNIKYKMMEFNLPIVGTVTDGEFCSLRSQGETRPLHLWQVVHDARESVSRMKKDTLLNILLPTNVIENAVPVMRTDNPVVPLHLKLQVYHFVHIRGRDPEEVFRLVRNQQVPDGYIAYAWNPSKTLETESYLECLRSILGTLYFRYTVDQLCEGGADFRTYLYVPEVDPVTLKVHHERADHCHLLKRIANHTRLGRYQGLNVDMLDQAMQNPGTGLTAAALRGVRKQSVPDAEKLLSRRVARFLQAEGEEGLAEYVDKVANWHEASDGRGISQLQRSKFNYEMLNYLLRELMPWFEETYDFRTIDVNRPWDTVRGFTRETLVEITTNIESQEFRRRENGHIGYPEHPRAGTTDDVEAFFSISHRHLGDTFTLMEFKDRWLKLVNEFNKRMDSSLPFYYWTLNERYMVDQPSFDRRPTFDGDVDARKHPLRLHRLRISSREDSSIFTAGRSFLPARNKQSVRQRFHRPEAGLPPVPEHQRLRIPQP